MIRFLRSFSSRYRRLLKVRYERDRRNIARNFRILVLLAEMETDPRVRVCLRAQNMALRSRLRAAGIFTEGQ